MRNSGFAMKSVIIDHLLIQELKDLNSVLGQMGSNLMQAQEFEQRVFETARTTTMCIEEAITYEKEKALQTQLIGEEVT